QEGSKSGSGSRSSSVSSASSSSKRQQQASSSSSNHAAKSSAGVQLQSQQAATQQPGSSSSSTSSMQSAKSSGCTEGAGAMAVYQRKLASKVKLVPCARIVATSASGSEVHAVLDAAAEEVIHNCAAAEEASNEGSEEKSPPALPKFTVCCESLVDFERRFGSSWRVEQLPTSADHAQRSLERARANIGATEGCVRCKEKGPKQAHNCSEHFAAWCFEGLRSGGGLSRDQLLYHSANVATSLKTGICVGVSAACATTT
ncbi:unnamed protein product, partial [Polarella glacialis]